MVARLAAVLDHDRIECARGINQPGHRRRPTFNHHGVDGMERGRIARGVDWFEFEPQIGRIK
jgi:hypothetical protein